MGVQLLPLTGGQLVGKEKAWEMVKIGQTDSRRTSSRSDRWLEQQLVMGRQYRSQYGRKAAV